MHEDGVLKIGSTGQQILLAADRVQVIQPSRDDTDMGFLSSRSSPR